MVLFFAVRGVRKCEKIYLKKKIVKRETFASLAEVFLGTLKKKVSGNFFRARGA